LPKDVWTFDIGGKMDKKRILIDGRFVGVGESVSRVTLEVLAGVLELDKTNSYTLLIRPVGQKELERYPIIKNARNCQVELLDIEHYSLSEQTKLLNYLNQKKYDLVHFTQFNHPVLYRGNFVVTIHDLTMLGHLHRQKFYRRLACRITMKSAITNSQHILSVSNFTKKELKEFYNVPDDKVTVTHLGIDHVRYNAGVKAQTEKIKAFKEKYKTGENYILYTGAWKKHKNLIRLLKAYELSLTQNPQLKTQNLNLVFVGKMDEKEPEVTAEIERINSSLAVILSDRGKPKDPVISPMVVLTGFIEEEELPIAYAGAMCYVIPSLNEGFGLPPLEAIACGTPVIASRESCIPEVLGDAAVYFDPYNVNDISRTIKEIASNSKLREELAEKGLVQAKKYNWSDTAQKTFEVYNKCLNL